MGVYRFAIPETLPEMLDVLNATFPEWNMWLHDAVPGEIIIFMGDQLCFTAHTRQEAEAYIAGVYSVAEIPDHVLRRYADSDSSHRDRSPY